MVTSLYIYWKRDCKIQHIDIKGFNDKINELEEKHYQKVKPSTRVLDYPNGSYSVKKERNKYLTIGVVHFDRSKEFFTTNWRDDAKNHNIGAGTDAFNAVNTRFEQRTGSRITKAFGSVNDYFKTCVPRQFYFINDMWKNKIISHVSAIDYCSQYPSMLCGRLPDGHPQTRKEFKGTVPPTPDYPFAFYVKSGHCAEYGVFDTHDWKNSLFRNALFGHKESFDGEPYMNPDEDYTILMKASDYTFDDEMKYFYELRHTDPTAKLVMNAFIGMLHTESYQSHKQAHIAAIVIARSNDRMLKLAEQIGIENVVHLCVDGCIYLGTEQYGGNKKALNLIFQEFHDCSFKMIGMNSYVAIKGGDVVKFKHGAYDMRTDGKDIEQCTGFDDMNFWIKRKIKEDILNGTA